MARSRHNYLSDVKPTSTSYRILTALLRAGLILALLAAGWWTYSELPDEPAATPAHSYADTTLQIILVPSPAMGSSLQIPIELYPVDIIAVRHEYFSERRAGKRFDDFLKERMKDRKSITTQLDHQGQASIAVPAGTWWIHAQLVGEEELEWRLPVSVGGSKQTIELTSQNVYSRARTF